jgi:hypothetical protein
MATMFPLNNLTALDRDESEKEVWLRITKLLWRFYRLFDLLRYHFFFWRWMGVVLGSIALGWVGLAWGWDGTE